MNWIDDILMEHGGLLDVGDYEQLSDMIKQELLKRLGEKKKESPHEYHTMDDNWCYNCQCIVDDESDDFPKGHYQYNECHDLVTKILEGE